MTSDLDTPAQKPKRSRAKKAAKSKATTAKRVSVLGKLTNWLLGTTSRSALIIAADPESGLVIPLSPQVRMRPDPSRGVAPARELAQVVS